MTVADPVATAQAIRTWLQSHGETVKSVSREIHQHPELGFEEFKASALLCELLESYGFTVSRGVCDMETAFVADWGSGGAQVAFVCEYDALRGLGHGCGHNLIGGASAAASIALAQALAANGVSARVRVIGSPAEEGGGGKIPFCDNGYFDEVDAALMFHPSDRTFAEVWAMGCSSWNWRFEGRAAHASLRPHEGVNALDAFVHAYNGVALWRQQLLDGSRVHGFIREGGTAPNITPEVTSGEFILRARRGEYLQQMIERFSQIMQAAADATGCRVTLERHGPDYLDLQSNPALVEVCHKHLSAVGLEPKPVEPWDRAASTDAGNMSYAVPTIHPKIAINDQGVSAHTREFCRLADTDHAYEVMLKAAEVLALCGRDVIVDTELRTRMADDFAQISGRREQWRGSGEQL